MLLKTRYQKKKSDPKLYRYLIYNRLYTSMITRGKVKKKK